METSKTTKATAVLGYIKSLGAYGATCDEVEQALGIPHQSASARIRELFLKGQIDVAIGLDSWPVQRRTRSGRKAYAWEAK